MSLKVSRRRRLRVVALLGIYLVAGGVLMIPTYKGDAVDNPATLETRVTPNSKTTNKKMGEKVIKKPVSKPVAVSTKSLTPVSCNTPQPMRANLQLSNIPQIRQLAKYEELCGGRVSSKLSFFIATPTNNTEADDYAKFTAKRLLEMSKYDIEPLVFFEPSAAEGVIDLKAFSEGKYDAALERFFRALGESGVSDAMMGTWVPVPEGNTPVWSTLDPRVYGRAVNKSISFQKKHFPASKSSVLLSSTTYYGSPEWDDGKSVSLRPYLASIKPGILDSFGMQGFPWVARGNAAATNGTPSDYLRKDIAIEAARILGLNEVWINTGTFGSKYVGTADRTDIPEGTRSSLLKGVMKQAKDIKSQGFSVAIHLFAEDKSSTAEKTDWSYWNGTSRTSDLVKQIVGDAGSGGVGFWLYDSQR